MPDAAAAAPLILGFDCSGPWCAAAILHGDQLLAQHHEAMQRGQAERLMPMLQKVLTDAGIGWQNLAAIGTGTGPGNFTGVRIAVATARGLALSLDVPAIAVSACEAAAFGVQRPCRVILPALRGQVFWQDFLSDDLPAQPAMPAQDSPDMLPPGPPVGTTTHPIAKAIARIAAQRLPMTPLPRPAPIYLRPADAAPPADQPPKILQG